MLRQRGPRRLQAVEEEAQAEVEDWGKKRLAYEIQKMREGFYYFIQFESEADAPAQIEQRVRIMDNVLRFLCVRKDEA